MWRYSRVVSLPCCLLSGKPDHLQHDIKMPSIKITTKLPKNNRCPKDSKPSTVESGLAWWAQDKPPPTINLREPTNLATLFNPSTAPLTRNPSICCRSLVKKGLSKGLSWSKTEGYFHAELNRSEPRSILISEDGSRDKSQFSRFFKILFGQLQVGLLFEIGRDIGSLNSASSHQP